MDIVNFDALTAQGRIIDPSQVNPEEDYFIIGKYTNHYSTNSQKYTKYPVYAIKAGDVMGGGSTPAYKVYIALVTQSGSNPISVKLLENTLSGTPIWTGSGGDYYATLAGAFPDPDKVFIVNNSVTLGDRKIEVYWQDVNNILLQTTLVSSYGGFASIQEDIFQGYVLPLEIRVYN